MPAGQGQMDIPAVLTAAPQALRVLEFDGYTGDIFHGLTEGRRTVLELDSRAHP
jgi:hypothetical protein